MAVMLASEIAEVAGGPALPGGERHAENLAQIASGAAFYRPIVADQVGEVAGRLLRSPIFAHWLPQALKLPPDQANGYAKRLELLAEATNDDQFQSDVAAYLAAVRACLSNGETMSDKDLAEQVKELREDLGKLALVVTQEAGLAYAYRALVQSMFNLGVDRSRLLEVVQDGMEQARSSLYKTEGVNQFAVAEFEAASANILATIAPSPPSSRKGVH